LPVKDDPPGGDKVDPWEKAWEKAASSVVAVVDCREEIPCNPCEDACAKGAIVVGADICSPPSYDPELCNGCGRCVAMCPGMAVFLLDRSGGKGMARITVPYEMHELMREGDEAWALDKEGRPLGRGEVVKVANVGKEHGTALVTLEIPEEWALKVRAVTNRVLSLEEPEEVAEYIKGEDYQLCRCEEIPDSRVRVMARGGFHALTALRRFSRVGLGYCQGRFCQAMLRSELSEATSRAPEEVGTFRVRPPVRPVKLSRLGGGDV
jgi:Fe-S-cluster-containing hydrogenase component 2